MNGVAMALHFGYAPNGVTVNAHRYASPIDDRMNLLSGDTEAVFVSFLGIAWWPNVTRRIQPLAICCL